LGRLKMALKESDIRNIFLFSELDNNEIEKIKSFSRHKTFNKGEILFFDTEPYQGFYCIIEGTVKLYKISKEGREHIMHIMKDGDTFGEVPVFENYEAVLRDLAKYPVNAMAIDDNTNTIQVPAKQFLEILRNSNELCMKFLSTLSKRLKILNSHIQGITLQDIKKRLSGYILSEHKRQSEERAKKIKVKGLKLPVSVNYIDLAISKNDLASHLGTIIETLSRTLKKLQDEDIIEVNSKRILIKNFKKLISYSD